jgi:hypothetical protein
MTQPVTLTAKVIATLAFTKALEKMVENFTEDALAKMDELRQKIWDKLRGNPRAENAFTAVEQGNKEELQRLAVYLQDAMEDDPQFANEVLALAQEINAGKLQDNSSMNQYNYDSSTGYQTKNLGGQNFVGGTHYHGNPP